MRDASGRLTQTEDSDLSTDLKYDALGRLSALTVTDPATKVSFITALTYDDAGRETGRTITDCATGHTLTVTQGWTLNSQLAECVTQWGGATVRKETYTYDVRNRLSGYKVMGMNLPQDAYGNKITAQTYQYDALNNLTTVTTTLADDGTDTATYHYGNGNDPTQLTSVTHTHDNYPQTVTLKYDAEGRMTQDEARRTLAYDIPGRLISISGNGSGEFGYDALNRLVSQNVSATDTRQYYYRGGERVNETRTPENKNVRLIKAGRACVGGRDGGRLTLTAGNLHNSLLWSRDTRQEDAELYCWTPYGSGQAVDELPGFNGEQADPISGTYHLGNGYRAYSPALMRFTCPDSLSPFGTGGINPYAYCAGDPVNITDPSGHVGMPEYFGGMLIAAATIAGLATALLSGGLAIAAAGGVMAAVGAASTTMLVAGGIGVASDVTALAGIALEDSHPEASAALGWAAMATGLAGVGSALRRASKGGRLPGTQNVGNEAPLLRLRGGGDEAKGITGITGLPPEMIRYIGSYLSLEDLQSLRRAYSAAEDAITVGDLTRAFQARQRRIKSILSFQTPLGKGEMAMIRDPNVSPDEALLMERRIRAEKFIAQFRSETPNREFGLAMKHILEMYKDMYGIDDIRATAHINI